MYQWSVRVGAFGLMAVGVALVAGGTVWADPPADDCHEECAERNDFIEPNTDKCYSYSPETCQHCGNGVDTNRCENPPHVNPTCVDLPPPAPRVMRTIFPAKSCKAVCFRNAGKWSEADQPQGKADTISVTWYRCVVSPE
ncbi:MAG: hypothetical protein K2X87_26980 [Gemmataceae bacterium]|nr:hypothetical protein [Gemmataceae bacterium]